MRNRKYRNEKIREKKYDPSTWSKLDIKEAAYHDGTRYHCTNIFCYADKVELREIGRMSNVTGESYIPILQCKKCKAHYFGLRTRDLDAEEVIRQHAEEMKRAEEERKQHAKAFAEMDAEAFYKEEKRREQEQREEVSAHESELAGDITIPNIIGEQQTKQTRPDNESINGDIILPNTLTI